MSEDVVEVTMEALVKLIARYTAVHSESESIFLTPYPRHQLDSHSLLDFISQASGISKEQIGEWCENE